LRADIDRKQLPDWMNAPFVRMPIDWMLLRKQGNEWLRYDWQARSFFLVLVNSEPTYPACGFAANPVGIYRS